MGPSLGGKSSLASTTANKLTAWGPKAKEAKEEKKPVNAKASVPNDDEAVAKADASEQKNKDEAPAADDVKKEISPTAKAADPVKLKEGEAAAAPKPQIKREEPRASTPKVAKKEEPKTPKLDSESFPTLGGTAATPKAWGPKAKQQAEALAEKLAKSNEDQT